MNRIVSPVAALALAGACSSSGSSRQEQAVAKACPCVCAEQIGTHELFELVGCPSVRACTDQCTGPFGHEHPLRDACAAAVLAAGDSCAAVDAALHTDACRTREDGGASGGMADEMRGGGLTCGGDAGPQILCETACSVSLPDAGQTGYQRLGCSSAAECSAGCAAHGGLHGAAAQGAFSDYEWCPGGCAALCGLDVNGTPFYQAFGCESAAACATGCTANAMRDGGLTPTQAWCPSPLGPGPDGGASGDCATHGTCGDCTTQPACGWCRDSGPCHAGSASGATDGSCSGSGWAYVPGDCGG